MQFSSWLSTLDCIRVQIHAQTLIKPRLLLLAAVYYMFIQAHLFYLGHAVAQLVEALCYKPEGRGFDP
jgi:hypothetical protein